MASAVVQDLCGIKPDHIDGPLTLMPDFQSPVLPKPSMAMLKVSYITITKHTLLRLYMGDVYNALTRSVVTPPIVQGPRELDGHTHHTELDTILFHSLQVVMEGRGGTLNPIS